MDKTNQNLITELFCNKINGQHCTFMSSLFQYDLTITINIEINILCNILIYNIFLTIIMSPNLIYVKLGHFLSDHNLIAIFLVLVALLLNP